jgi:hypothetical protein
MPSVSDLAQTVVNNLSDDLRLPKYRGKSKLAGHCYVASEALWHLLGKEWVPQCVRHEGDTHWYLRHKNGEVLDVTAGQFTSPVPYHLGRGKGFLTKKPSKRAASLLEAVRRTRAQ